MTNAKNLCDKTTTIRSPCSNPHNRIPLTSTDSRFNEKPLSPTGVGESPHSDASDRMAAPIKLVAVCVLRASEQHHITLTRNIDSRDSQLHAT